MGKGVFPEDHPLALGMTGIWGTRPANDDHARRRRHPGGRHRLRRSRLQLVATRSTRSRFRRRELIQIDIDPGEIGKIYPVEVGIVGDAKATLRALIDRLGTTPRAATRCTRAVQRSSTQRKRDWRAELTETQDDAGTPIHPARLLAGAVGGGARGRHLRHRRGLEQERRGPAAAERAPRVVHHQRRHGDDGLSRRPRRSAPRSARPTARSSAWSATAD